MREIKFRAWDKHGNKMLTQLNGGCGYEDLCLADVLFDKSYIPMQFSGLKDKNGKEMYEGDILSQFILGDKEVRGVMYFNENTAQFGMDAYVSFDAPPHFEVRESQYGRPEVIGNIYENPELLDPEK